MFEIGELRLGIQGFPFKMKSPQLLVSHENRVQDRDVVELGMILAQIPEGTALSNADFSLAGGDETRQNLDECGLSGSVRADQSIAVSRGEQDGYVLE
jgi:hypothetical protein